MSRIDHMKVIGVLTKTLKMEAIDVQCVNNSSDTLEITLGGPAGPEKKFIMTLAGGFLLLSFRKDYMSAEALEKWRSSFEYELEQAFMKNIGIQFTQDAGNTIVKIGY